MTVQNNVITRNPRIGVSHDGHSVWNLHIRDVERSDEGQYMCQINTARAKTRLGNLHVVGKLTKNHRSNKWKRNKHMDGSYIRKVPKTNNYKVT